jgi:hypothetical protein
VRGCRGGGGGFVDVFVPGLCPRFAGARSGAGEELCGLVCTGVLLLICRFGIFFLGSLFVSASLPPRFFELVWKIWPALPGECSRPPVPEPDLSPHLQGWGAFRGVQSLDGDGWCRCVDAFVLPFPSIGETKKRRSCAAEMWPWSELLPSLVFILFSCAVRVFLHLSAMYVYVVLVCLYGSLYLFCDV